MSVTNKYCISEKVFFIPPCKHTTEIFFAPSFTNQLQYSACLPVASVKNKVRLTCKYGQTLSANSSII